MGGLSRRCGHAAGETLRPIIFRHFSTLLRCKLRPAAVRPPCGRPSRTFSPLSGSFQSKEPNNGIGFQANLRRRDSRFLCVGASTALVLRRREAASKDDSRTRPTSCAASRGSRRGTGEHALGAGAFEGDAARLHRLSGGSPPGHFRESGEAPLSQRIGRVEPIPRLRHQPLALQILHERIDGVLRYLRQIFHVPDPQLTWRRKSFAAHCARDRSAPAAAAARRDGRTKRIEGAPSRPQ